MEAIKIENSLLPIKSLQYFLVILFFHLVIAFCINFFFINETVFYNTYADMFAYERAMEIFSVQSRYQWIGYILLPVTLIIKIIYNTTCVTVGSLLHQERGEFESNFNICLKAEYVFVAMLLVKLAFFAFFKEVETLNDLGFIPGSLLNLFDANEVPKWAIYPLQTINIWEVWFCWVGTSLYSIQFNISKAKAAALFCIPYLIGLFIWILVVVFITLQST